MKVSRVFVASVLALSCGLQVATASGAAADINPRAGDAAKAALNPAAANITLVMAGPVAANTKLNQAVTAAVQNWNNALGLPNFLKVITDWKTNGQQDPHYPYAMTTGIAFNYSTDGTVATALAAPDRGLCSPAADLAGCQLNPAGTVVRIWINKTWAESSTNGGVTPMTNNLVREIGRALGLNYAKAPVTCDEALAEPLPANCTARASKPNAKEVIAVKRLYGIPLTPLPVVDWAPSSGQTVNDAAGSNNATVQGGTATYTTGLTGPAVNLNGTTYVSAPGSSIGALSEFSVDTQFRVDAEGTYQRIVDYVLPPGTSSPGFIIDLDPQRKVRFVGAGAGQVTPVVVPKGQFVNLAVTRNSSGLVTVYLDGVKAWSGSVGGTAPIAAGTGNLNFGADQSGGSRLTGAMGRTRLYNKAIDFTR